MTQQTDSFEFKDENARFGIKNEWMNKPLHIGGQKQQTAVEWLQHLYENRPESDLLEQDFEQAKQMEKEQIIEAFDCDGSPQPGEKWISNGEQYYNETYGKIV